MLIVCRAILVSQVVIVKILKVYEGDAVVVVEVTVGIEARIFITFTVKFLSVLLVLSNIFLNCFLIEANGAGTMVFCPETQSFIMNTTYYNDCQPRMDSSPHLLWSFPGEESLSHLNHGGTVEPRRVDRTEPEI